MPASLAMTLTLAPEYPRRANARLAQSKRRRRLSSDILSNVGVQRDRFPFRAASGSP